MKKVVRTVWISLLSGLAFLVACTCSKGLTRAEKKQLKAERTDLITKINAQKDFNSNDPKVMFEIKQDEKRFRDRLNEIDMQLGNKESIAENNAQIAVVNSEIDSLMNVIKAAHEPEPCVYGPPVTEPTTTVSEKEQLRQSLNLRLKELRQVLKRREGACVYGSPEVIQRYGEETRRLKNEAAEIEKQLKELDDE